MFVTTLSSALPTLSRATARGVLSRVRGVRWIVTIWCLLFTVSVFSATHFPDGQAADDALEAIEAVVDDVPGDALQAAKPGKGFERASLRLAPRSIYHLSGPARHEWEHGIAAHDALRWSVTFRSLK